MVRIKTVLGWLAYSIALLGFVPLFPYLETVPRLFFPAAVAAGIVIDRKGLPIQGRVPTVISLFFFLFYASRFSRDNLVGTAVNLLVILLAVRLVSEKSARNYLQIFALSLFSLAGSSLFSLSAVFLCYFLLMLTLIAVSLVVLTFYSSAATQAVSVSGMKRIVSVALVMPVASLPLVLLFFFILPRTQYPLWNFLNVEGAKVTGFSDKVEPGSTSAVGTVRTIAFRVKCGKLPKSQLYWRGIVLNSFDGNAWVRRDPPAVESGVAKTGEMVRQTIFPEPGRGPQLLALNIPRMVSGVRLTSNPDCTYLRRGATGGHEKYEALSSLSDTIVVKNGIDAEFYLKVPPRLSPRMRALGMSMAGAGKSDTEKTALLGDFFRGGHFSYATSGLPVGEQPLDAFLFEKKKGNCEFFASTFAVLLRSAGVPARLVGGYYGGDYNELGGYYVITEDMAHVWVEAYLGGRGWVTIDLSRWAVNYSGSGETGQRGFMRTTMMALDALGYYWNLAVINYDLERQLRLVAGANGHLQQLLVPGRFDYRLLYALLPVLVVAGALRLIRWGRISREERLLRLFLANVHRHYGIKISAATGLHELAVELNDPCADRFVELYCGTVYRDRSLTPAEIKQLKGLARGLRNRKEKAVNIRPEESRH